MVNCAFVFNGLARNTSMRRGKDCESNTGREAAKALAKEARKNFLVCSSGIVKAEKSANSTSSFTKRGEKGVNQDCIIVWEDFGCQEDILFCGVFDGHGPWGHLVAKRVMKLFSTSLHCNWQETLRLVSLDQDFELEAGKYLHEGEVWKKSYLKTCAAIDEELQKATEINSFCSGTTALALVKQCGMIFLANVGDSRAVLATTSDDGNLVPIQLTVDFTPNLPQEAERIKKSKGRVLCLHDEPGVYRVWKPNGDTPGLSLSRAFGDHSMKDCGVISVPEVTQRKITSQDQFVILATDGVWEVLSNQEAVQIVASASDREKSAKRLVDNATHAWRHKKRGVAIDDISAICLFFHASKNEQVALAESSKDRLA